MRSETISVCMATYNGGVYLKEQLESILPQLNSFDEVIISDDGSYDDTQEIVKAFKDNRIKFYQHKKIKRYFWHAHPSYSATNNFENALALSKGDFIYLCDQDDVWEPNKIDATLLVFKEFNYDLVLHDARIINNEGKLLFESLFDYQQTRRGFFHNFKRNTYTGCSLVFKRKVLDIVMPIPTGVIGHDMWIGMLSERIMKVGIINDKLTRYRFHQNNATYSDSGNKNTIFFRIYYRIQFLYYFLLRLFKKF